MQTIKDRLNDLIKELKLSKNEFAREINSSSAMISKITTKEINFGVDVYQKIISKYPNLNQKWLLTGIGEMWAGDINEENNRFEYTGYYHENKIDFYYKHPETQLDRFLSSATDELKEAFNNWKNLIEISNSFGPPDFIKERFVEHCTFKEYKKEIDNSLTEDHSHITDKKLFKCVKLLAYQDGIEHSRYLTTQFINYLLRYTDMYKGYILNK